MTALLQPLDLSGTNLGDQPRASLALLFHTQGHGNSMLAVVTAHDVLTDAHGHPHIGPGRVALPHDQHRIAELLASRPKRGRVTVLPPEVLHTDDDTLAWWLPPERRPMLLRDHEGHDHAVSVIWPSLVALVVRRKLYLAATADGSRPTEATPLYHGPVPNLYANGRVCTGSARLPAGQRLNDLPAWTDVITRTWFTHDLHQNVLPTKHRRRKTGTGASDYRACAFWLGRVDAQAAPTASDMVPLGMNVGDWIEAIVDGEDEE